MTPIKYLLLDLDGTLLGSRNLPLRLCIVLRAMVAWKSVRKTLKAFQMMQKALEEEPTGEQNDVRAVRAFSKVFGLDEEQGRFLLESSLLRIFPKLSSYFFPIPGAAEFVKWASTKYPLILATNPVWLPEIVELRVRWAKLDPSIFKTMTHARRMTACKPRKEYYLELLKQESLDPQSCLLVGNDFRKDLPAVEAGIRVFILNKEKKAKSIPIFRPGISSAISGLGLSSGSGSGSSSGSGSGSTLAWQGDYFALREFLTHEEFV